ncbi:MAG: hypothetical protein WBC48_00715 [Minisyncoccales bacterium]
MNLKSKILAAGLAAIIAGFGMFAANINTVQAQTDGAQTDGAIAQMMQMIETLKQQIQQIITLIAQLKPQETCGNGACRFGETAASCPTDCKKNCGNGIIEHDESIDSCPVDWKNSNSCYGENAIPSPQEKCCTGLTAYLFNGREEEKDGACIQTQKLWDNGYSFYKCINCGDGKCNSAIGENACNCSADCARSSTNCAKEGETIYSYNQQSCCAGLQKVMITSGLSANGSASVYKCLKPAVCGNKKCEALETISSCPTDCKATACAQENEFISFASAKPCCAGLIKKEQYRESPPCLLSGSCDKVNTATSIGYFCAKPETYNGKIQCSATGGAWKYSECTPGCVFNTKAERIAGGGKVCATVCVKDYTCECASGKYWASREEGCIDADQANIAGGNCTYKTYTGTCTKTGTSADGISYTFTPFQTPDISGTFLTSASQINPYRGITDTWQIANLTQTSCELKVIVNGTCTPIIMRLVLSFD